MFQRAGNVVPTLSVTETAQNIDVIDEGTHALTIGAIQVGLAGHHTFGYQYCALAYKRELSTREIDSLFENQWQGLEPRISWIPVSGARHGIDWKLRYDDDTTYSSDLLWKDAPTQGVVNCTVLDTTGQWGRFVNSGYAPHTKLEDEPYYVCFPDSSEPYVTFDLAPFRDKMAAQFPAEIADDWIKFGRQVDQLHWEQIQNLAAADTDFPTATSPRRRSSDFPAP